MTPMHRADNRTWLQKYWPNLAWLTAAALFLLYALATRDARAQVTAPPNPALQWPTARALARYDLPLGAVNVDAVRAALTADPGTNTPNKPEDDTPDDPTDDFILGGVINVPAQVGTSCVISGKKLDLSGGMTCVVQGTGDASIIYLTNGAWIDCSGSSVDFRHLRIMQDNSKAAIVYCRGKNKDGTPRTASINRCSLTDVRIDAAEGNGSQVGSLVSYGMEHFTARECHIENKKPGGHTIILDSAYLPQFGYSADVVSYTNSGLRFEDCIIGVRGGSGAESAFVIGDMTTELVFDGWICTSGMIDSLLKIRGDTVAFNRSRRPQNLVFDIAPECSPVPPVMVRFLGTSKFSDLELRGYWKNKVLDGFEYGYPRR